MKYLSISFKSLFLFIILLTSTSGANALDLAERMAVADSLRMRLTQKISPSDSLSVLVNLYDVLPRSQGNLLADSIINLAMRTREEMVAFDIIRNDVNRHMRSDSIIESRLKLTLEKFPLSEGREETETFIRMVRNMRRSIYADEFDRNIMLERLKQEFDNNPPTDLYERIVLLHAMVMMLSQDPNSSLMVQYMDTLGQLVNQLPPMAFSVRNAFNVHAATAFQNSDPVKSLEADRRSLNDINKLVKFYSDRGRHFRIYDTNRYVIYCRMLNNWSVLSDKEFDDLYDQAIQLTETDPDARARYQAFAEPDLYRSLRYKDYEKAYPLLKKMIEPKVFSTLSNPRRIRVLKNFILTCKTLNKSDDLAEASLRLNEILEKEMEFRTQGLFREIRLAYANYDMRRHYGDLENETRKSRERLTIEVLVLSILGLVLMGIFIVLLLRQYSRMRVLAKSLKISNAKLQKESTNLKKAKVELTRARDSAVKANALKSDFIKNLSYEIRIPLQAINEYSRLIADCADPGTKEYLRNFTDLIEHNSELLTTIINDVIHLSELESDTMNVQRQLVSLRVLCRTVVETLRSRVKNPDLKIRLASNLPDIQINSDQSRVQQILLNLLINAVKFTPKGTITLGYKVDEDKNEVNFYVEDTGIGINPENKEKIFERFVKLDSNTQGAGLGLTISRMLARLLGGDLSLDTSYLGGARFVLSLPR